MWDTINQLTIAAYLAVTGYAKNWKKEFMEDERGLSGVVVAILLILVAVLAVAMLWGFLGEWLGEMWENITGKASSIG